jgi:hypothetical protein
LRKYIATFLAGSALMFSAQGFAEDGLQKIEAYLRPGLPITLDGHSVTLESPAVMVNGNTYLKLRDVARLSGLGVEWNESSQTVILNTYGGVPIPLPQTNPMPNPTIPTSTPTSLPPYNQPTSEPQIPSKIMKFGETLEANGLQITFSNFRVEPANDPTDIYYGNDKNLHYDVTLVRTDQSVLKDDPKLEGGLVDASGNVFMNSINAHISDYLSKETTFSQHIHIKLSKDSPTPTSILIKSKALNIDNVTWVAK